MRGDAGPRVSCGFATMAVASFTPIESNLKLFVVL
jgi:hypothetical protein